MNKISCFRNVNYKVRYSIAELILQLAAIVTKISAFLESAVLVINVKSIPATLSYPEGILSDG